MMIAKRQYSVRMIDSGDYSVNSSNSFTVPWIEDIEPIVRQIRTKM